MSPTIGEALLIAGVILVAGAIGYLTFRNTSSGDVAKTSEERLAALVGWSGVMGIIGFLLWAALRGLGIDARDHLPLLGVLVVPYLLGAGAGHASRRPSIQRVLMNLGLMRKGGISPWRRLTMPRGSGALGPEMFAHFERNGTKYRCAVRLASDEQIYGTRVAKYDGFRNEWVPIPGFTVLLLNFGERVLFLKEGTPLYPTQGEGESERPGHRSKRLGKHFPERSRHEADRW